MARVALVDGTAEGQTGGVGTGTAWDDEYTDWDEVESFADALASVVAASASSGVTSRT
ncbi:hypothetical protein [Haloplanus rubicundus]|uniref:hypothetical protein n=1 Tax=Haloplanus rubicundus TaxID=1547898 RepID=UPI0013009DF4|nr:hypothetical protein [Haloplanus rubicundus]